MEGFGNKLKLFIIGASFMFCFGLIDNGGLWLGFSAIDGWLQSLGYSPLVSALLGNTFSDMLGALLGGAVSVGLYKLFKVKEDKVSMAAQMFGITAGCLLPAIIVMILEKL